MFVISPSLSCGRRSGVSQHAAADNKNETHFNRVSLSLRKNLSCPQNHVGMQNSAHHLLVPQNTIPAESKMSISTLFTTLDVRTQARRHRNRTAPKVHSLATLKRHSTVVETGHEPPPERECPPPQTQVTNTRPHPVVLSPLSSRTTQDTNGTNDTSPAHTTTTPKNMPQEKHIWHCSYPMANAQAS